MALYFRSYGYRNHLRAGATRVDLSGAEAGLVAAEHAATAEELQRRRDQWHARKKARKGQKAAQEAKAARAHQEDEVAAARPKRLGLADLKAAAAARRQAETM